MTARRLSYAGLIVLTLLFAHLLDKCSAGIAAYSTGEVELRG